MKKEINPKMRQIIELAERFIEDQGQERSSLAKKLDFTPRYIADIKSGKCQQPGANFMLALINKLNFNPEWLATSEGEVFLSEPNKEVEKPKEGYKIPLLRQKVSCGPGQNWEDDDNIEKFMDIFTMIPRLTSGRIYAFQAKGYSMIGAGIKDGDFVLFDSNIERPPKDGIYVFSLDGDTYCKQLEFDEIAGKVRIFSVRTTDFDKADLIVTLNFREEVTIERFHIFGRVCSWVHPN